MFLTRSLPTPIQLYRTLFVDLRKLLCLPGEPGRKELEAKISMFADDTQLFNKDERSVEKSFDILSKYEKASGSRINYPL
jgi:hypothetical protein